MEQELKKSIKEHLQDKKELVKEIKRYRLTPKEIMTIEVGKYNEYMDGILIKDITNLEQTALGITILHVIANKSTDFSLHLHEKQSQTISVIRGKILDLNNNISFHTGESYFVSRNKEHSIRYYEGTELLIVYMPSLTEVNK
jgi:hypothetical protein